MKIKTNELTDVALDWAVAMALNVGPKWNMQSHGLVWPGAWITGGGEYRKLPIYHKDWSEGGPIIEREGINIFKCNKLDPAELNRWRGHKIDKKLDWRGDSFSVAIALDGPTPLIAAMRCYVASKLGNEINIPEKLIT